jgi:hypothetical protein
LRRLLLVLFAALLIFAFVPPKPAKAMDMSYFGVNEHPYRYTDYAALIDQMAASQIKWVRFSVEWNNIEPSKGVHPADVMAKIDDIVNRLTAKGIQIEWVLGYTAEWATSCTSCTWPDDTRYKPADWADWENFVTYITGRYKGIIHYWEVWNEQDLSGFWKSSIDDYYTLLQKAYAKIKATDSTNSVLLGGMALSTGYGLGTWFDSLMGVIGANNVPFDIINYHSYGDSRVQVSRYNGTMDVINKYSSSLAGIPIWITETGLTSSNGTTEYQKADYVDQVYLLNKRWPNIFKVFWYNYRDKNTGNPVEDNYGLTAQDLTPFKALYHYQALNGAESVFGSQPESALTLYVNQAPSDSGVTFNADGTMTIATNKYAYFKVNDQWLFDTNEGVDPSVQIEVTYLDSSPVSGTKWSMQYDGQLSNFQAAPAVNYTNTGTWKTKIYSNSDLHDIKFANRQFLGSDFRLAANGAPLTVSKVVVKKRTDRADIQLKSTNRYTLVEQITSTDPSQEAYSAWTTIGGREAREILGNSNFIYLRVSDGFARAGDTNLTINVTYYDSGTDKILVQYNAIGNVYKPLPINKTNTNTWLTQSFAVTDANLTNALSYFCDIRIGNYWDANGAPEYISKVEIIK